MTSFMAGHRRSSVAYLLASAVVVLLMPGSETRAGYSYQTRHTNESPNVERFRHVAVKLGDGRVGLFGGFGRLDLQLFDPATEQFVTSKASQWFADFEGTSLPDGNALLVDGEHDRIYDYLTDRYVVPQNSYTGGFIRFPVLVPLPDGTIFICGGYNNDFEASRACGSFDPTTLRFKSLHSLIVARVSHSAIVLDDRRVLVIGGSDNTMESYDIQTGASTVLSTRLHYSRGYHCSMALPDKRALILGGGPLNSSSPMTTEIFDPAKMTLADGPSLGLGRQGARLAVMPSGRIAVIGGYYDSRVIELYCPQTGTFELADSLMVDPRWQYFTATSLDSGAVLIVGGRVDAGERTIRDAEILEEVPTDKPSPPPMTLASIRQLLSDPDPNVVNETVDWLVRLGPQVKPILEALHQGESAELCLLAGSILQSIDEREYPQRWCVELWNESSLEDTVWLMGFDCADYRNVGFPDPHFSDILWATEETQSTHLVVRFPTHITYRDKVRLFNLVGWTLVPRVTLGDDLEL
jgi:hypothetical protein